MLPKLERLMVIIPDRLSELAKKGELTERYYNPGDLFKEVHLVLINDDRPDPFRLKPLVGSASLHIHNLVPQKGMFTRTLGWQDYLLGQWKQAARRLGTQIRPQLIRCHGSHINVLAGREIADALAPRPPLITSLHNRPDIILENLSTWHKIRASAEQALAKRMLYKADIVVAVYESQLPYLDSIGLTNWTIGYNVLSPNGITEKTQYELGKPVKILSVGRMIPGKNPCNIIKAIADIPGCELTICGDGPLKRPAKNLAKQLNIQERVHFIDAMDNRELCSSFKHFDIFACHNDYPGVPKAVFEPLLAGLPVVINRQPIDHAPELTDNICVLVDNSPEGYRSAIEKLTNSRPLREMFGARSKEVANSKWHPSVTEEQYVTIYMKALNNGP